MKKLKSVVIGIPTDRLPLVERMLGRKLATNQIPIVKIRVPAADVARIRKAIK